MDGNVAHVHVQDFYSARHTVQELASSALHETRQTLGGDMGVRMLGSDSRMDAERRINGNGISPNLSPELQQIKADIEKLKHSLAEEMSTRKTGDALSGEACLQLQAQMRDLVGTSTDRDATRLETLHGDVERKVLEIRLALDVEAKERRASDDDILQRIGELFVKLEQECGNREMADTNMRSQIGSWREELSMERASRGDEEVRMRCSFQKTEVTLTEKLNEILKEREGFTRQMNQFKHRLNEISSNLDIELQKKVGDCKIAVERCEKKLGSQVDRDFVMRKHEAATETLTDCWARISELSGRLDSEARERTGGDEITLARVRDLAAALKQEKDEREMWREHAGENAAGGLEDMIAEREARISETASLRREIAALNRKTSDFQMTLTSVARASVEQPRIEERAPPVDTGNTGNTVEAIRAISEQLNIESQERRSADELAARRIQELSASLKQEKGERELGDSSTRTQLVSCLKELVGEKEKRVDDHSSLRRVFQSLEEQVGQQLSDLRLSFEQEVDLRRQADGRLHGASSDESARTLRQEIHEEIVQLKSSLQFNVGGEEVRREREERQMEDRSLHQLLGNLTEQINHIFDEARTGWEEESQRLWEALHTHTHDVHLKNPDGSLSVDTHSMGRALVGSMGPMGSMGPPGPLLSQTVPSMPAPWKSPPTISVSMRAGGGMPMHNPLIGGRGSSLNASPGLSGREPLTRGSYLDHFTPSRGNP